ncbi:hypothetical protein B0H19DRAFT_398324 [Mycena capillaripes]|nr:hypothetical protein B0H19DRAFT_398324 [Mycena capillaripes]
MLTYNRFFSLFSRLFFSSHLICTHLTVAYIHSLARSVYPFLPLYIRTRPCCLRYPRSGRCFPLCTDAFLVPLSGSIKMAPCVCVSFLVLCPTPR